MSKLTKTAIALTFAFPVVANAENGGEVKDTFRPVSELREIEINERKCVGGLIGTTLRALNNRYPDTAYYDKSLGTWVLPCPRPNS